MTRIQLWTVTLSCVLIAFFSGCRSMTPAVNYYFLTPLSAGPFASVNSDGIRDMRVGILPIELPGYINRAQMVKRIGVNRMAVSSLNRWADYPDRMIQRVIGENLQLLLAEARIYSAPWPVGLQPDIVVDFSFFELIGTDDKKIRLSVVWTIRAKDDPAAVLSRRTSLSEKMPGSGFEDLAAAHSQVLTTLCRDVAHALNGFSAQ